MAPAARPRDRAEILREGDGQNSKAMVPALSSSLHST